MKLQDSDQPPDLTAEDDSNDSRAEAGTADRAPVMPNAALSVVRQTRPVTGRVVDTHLCMKGRSASYVRHFAVDVSGTPLQGLFLPGQAFGVVPPGLDPQGRPHKLRLYSVASPSWGEDGQGAVISTTVKRLIEERKPMLPTDAPDVHGLFLGVCSNYMCDLRLGDEVKVTGPHGKRFLLPRNPEEHDYLFLATGTGIAPFRAMVLELLRSRQPVNSQIHLVAGVPYTTDLMYDDQFAGLAAEHPNFHYHPVISRERAPGGVRYVHHLIDRDIERFGPLLESPRTLIYVCGIAGMQLGLYQALARHGLIQPFARVGGELDGVDPAQWREEQILREVRPKGRCFIEVY